MCKVQQMVLVLGQYKHSIFYSLYHNAQLSIAMFTNCASIKPNDSN